MATSIIGSIQVPRGTKVTIDVDTVLSPDSDNPIANSAVYEAVQELQNQIEDINSKLDIIVVDVLPAEDINSSAIYLVPLESEDEQNKFEEYIYVNSKWEKIGIYNSSVDLSQYLTKAEAESTYVKQVDIPTHLPNPEALTIKYNGVTAFTYDGSTAETGNFVVNAETIPLSESDSTTLSNKLTDISDKVDNIESPYNVNITNLLQADTSEAISEAIGGIDNLNATITKNQNIIGTLNNGEVSVSIRRLGNVTSLYYILDTLAGYTVNEINITNTSGTLSKTIVSHAMMTEEMVIDNLTTSESTLPLSANQGKILNDTKQDTLVSGTNIKTINNESLLGEGNLNILSEIPVASTDTLGGVKIGEGLQIDDEGTLSSSGEYLPTVNPVVKRDENHDATLTIGDKIILKDYGSGDAVPQVEITENHIAFGENLDAFGYVQNNQSSLGRASLMFIDGTAPDGQDMRPATEITANTIKLGTYIASGPSGPSDLIINKSGIIISTATSEDLLHAGGGTTRLKTINNTSLLGEGNIEVSANIPIASNTVLGGIKVGAGLSINPDTGVLSATGGGTADSVDWANITSKPDSFTPAAHTHQIADVEGLQGELDSKQPVGNYALKSEIPANTSQLYNDSGFITQAAVDTVVGDAPESLNTIEKLADALLNNPNILSTINQTLNNKQDVLVSGEDIKTINNQSLLGSGNIDIDVIKYWDYETYLKDQEISSSAQEFIENAKVGDIITNVTLNTEGGEEYQIQGINKAVSGNVIYQLGLSSYLQTTRFYKVTIGISSGQVSWTYVDALSESQVNTIVSNKISELVDSAPSTLDTLNELAAALGDDPNFATTVTNQIASKQDSLVSGVNIKTINGASLLGEGNITIETPEGGISDAPQDGNLYGRKDGQWTEVVIPDTSNLATKDEVNTKLDTSTYNQDKVTFALKSEIPTDYLTSEDLAGYETTEHANATFQPKGDYITAIPDEYITETELEGKGYAIKTELNGKANLEGAEFTGSVAVPDLSINHSTDGIMFNVSKQSRDILFRTMNAGIDSISFQVQNAYPLKLTEAGIYENNQLLEMKYAKIDDIPTVPTKISQLENDSNFITSKQLPDVSDMLTKTEASGTYQLKGNYLTSVPQAGQDVIGGIKVNYAEADKNYAVKLDGEGRAYVTVNWTSYSNATAEQAGLMSKDDKSKLDEIPENASEVSFSQSLNQGTEIGTITINGTPTTLYAPTAGESVTYGQATDTSLGLVKIGYTQNGNNYPVQLDGDGKMFVNVAESSDLQTLKEQVAKLMAEIFPLSLTASGGGNYEQGTSQTVTITWNLTQGGDQVTPDSFTINDEPVTFSDKSKQYTQVTTNTTYVVKATVGDETLSKTLYARFYSPRYWGIVDVDFEPTETSIKGLQKLSISSSRSYSRSGISMVEQKICYAYPKSFGALTAIKDGNNFDNLGSYTQSEIIVDGVSYYVYLMIDSVSGDGITQNYS